MDCGQGGAALPDAAGVRPTTLSVPAWACPSEAVSAGWVALCASVLRRALVWRACGSRPGPRWAWGEHFDPPRGLVLSVVTGLRSCRSVCMRFGW